VELALAVDAELFRLEGVVRWMDAADVRLSERGRDTDDQGRVGRVEPQGARAGRR
jgi:hypothetical protein